MKECCKKEMEKILNIISLNADIAMAISKSLKELVETTEIYKVE